MNTNSYAARKTFVLLALVAIVILSGARRAAQGQQWTGPDANGNISNTNTGKVGVGTSAPANLLDVGSAAIGTMLGNSIVVSNSTGPSSVAVGQSVTARGRMKWNFSGTEANAYLSLGVTSGTNPLILQDAGGNVGIGTTNPTYKLSVEGSAYVLGGTGSPFFEGFRIRASDFATNGGYLLFGKQSGNGGYGVIQSGDNLNYRTLSLNPSGGNIGIGTASPTNLLHVNSGAIPSSQFRLSANNAGSLSALSHAPDNAAVGFDVDWSTGTGWIARHSTIATLYKLGGKLQVLGWAGATVGSPIPDMTVHTSLDLTTGRFGIGVANPAYKLDVAGPVRSSSGGFVFPDGTVQTTAATGGGTASQWGGTSGNPIYYTGGNVGIGTTTPQSHLDITQSAPSFRFVWTNAANYGGTSFWENSSFRGVVQQIGSAFSDTSRRNNIEITNATASGAISMWTNTSEKVRIDPSGNVGIGTASPGKKLDIRSAEIRFGNYTDDTGLTKTDSVSNTFYISRSSGSSEATNIGPGYSHKAMITTGETSQWIVDTGAMLMLRSLYTTLGNADYPYTRPGGNVEFYYKRPGATVSPFTSSTKFYDDTTTLPAYVNFKPELGFILNSTGNVGIGTVAPNYKLDVNGEINATGLRINGTPISGGGGSQWSNGTNSIYYSAGNVGLGTGDPAEKLEVAGSVYISGANYLRFPHAYGDANDGKIGNSMFGSGLNLVGINNDNTFRKIQLWGQITQNQNDGTNSWAGTNYFSGNVGIGNNSPSTKLQVAGGTRIDGTNGRVYLGTGAAAGSRGLEFIEENATTFSIRHHDPNVAWQNIVINPYAGKVGIGTLTPTETLEVGGNIKASGTIFAKYQDVAEWVPSSEQLAAGTVVVLDTTKSNQVISSNAAYDTRVAGVISAQPGIALGESGEGKVLVATTGRVRVKVDASRGAIQIGDLLVTSDVPGVAMKSEAVNLGGVQIHRPGTIVGKALEPLAKGTGEILVLLSLQ